jgi:hypothetical protein
MYRDSENNSNKRSWSSDRTGGDKQHNGYNRTTGTPTKKHATAAAAEVDPPEEKEESDSTQTTDQSVTTD